MKEKIKRTLKTAIVTLVSVFSGIWFFVNHVMDWIGRSTLQDDFQNFKQMLAAFAESLSGAPWWISAGLFVLSFSYLLWMTRISGPYVARQEIEQASRRLNALEALNAGNKESLRSMHGSIADFTRTHSELTQSQISEFRGEILALIDQQDARMKRLTITFCNEKYKILEKLISDINHVISIDKDHVIFSKMHDEWNIELHRFILAISGYDEEAFHIRPGDVLDWSAPALSDAGLPVLPDALDPNRLASEWRSAPDLTLFKARHFAIESKKLIWRYRSSADIHNAVEG